MDRKYFFYLIFSITALIWGNVPSEIKTFRGSIDNKFHIKMTLNIKGNGDIEGFYYYENKKIHIPLKGKLVNNKIELAENVVFSAQFSQGFKGTFSHNAITGIWADSIKNQKYKFALALEQNDTPNKKLLKREGDYLDIKSDATQTKKLRLIYVSNNLFKFELTTQSQNGCTGMITGILAFNSEQAIYNDEGCESLKIVLLGSDKLEITETNCNYHGMQCDFEGSYKKQ